MGNGKFIFVVCGAKSHIDTLNFSLKYLKHFSKNQVAVITDLSRNSGIIEHNDIINIKTPDNFTHHQASIFLKTSIHRYLDMGDQYCYLDSDVVALNHDVDTIFNHFIPPIIFAPDHCRINEFSPSAIKCNCKKKMLENIEGLATQIKKYNPYINIEKQNFNPLSRELKRLISKAKNNPLKYFPFLLKYFTYLFIFPKRSFKLSENIYFNGQNKTWCDADDNVFLYHPLNYYKQIEKHSDFTYKLPRFEWFDKSGKPVYSCNCNHLIENISSKFKIDISNKKWQHWNGGVFLFNQKSTGFLEKWHQRTLEIFNDREWETRDQGTLAACAWDFKLQFHPTLPKSFNFIADFNNPLITFNPAKGFTADNFETLMNPAFIHIYHKFGFKGWEVWDAVENIFQSSVEKLNPVLK